MRREILSKFKNLPTSGDYLHRDCYDAAKKYSKDTFIVIEKLGTNFLPTLFELKRKDYKGWAKGLKAAGYATDPKYAEKLISLIERFNLTRFDE